MSTTAEVDLQTQEAQAKLMRRRQEEETRKASEAAVSRSEMPTAMTKCKSEGCGVEFSYVIFPFKGVAPEKLVPSLCPACTERIEQQERLKAEQERQKKILTKKELHERGWLALCPEKYRTVEEGGETEISRLPADKLAKVLAWSEQSRPRSLMLHGVTGRCKTRIVWRLLRRLYDEGKNIVVFDNLIVGEKSRSFGSLCAKAFRDGTEVEWIKSILKADVVFFDDLWKFAVTERVDAELFLLVENLGANCVPYFCTTNFTGEMLVAEAKKPNARISLDRAEAILRRLRDDCRTISFV